MLLHLSPAASGPGPYRAALLALSGCVNTSLIDRWKDPGFSGPPLHKVLVVGVQKDDGRRRCGRTPWSAR